MATPLAPILIPAAGQALGSALNFFTGKGAAKKQEKAANAALSFAKDQEARRRQEYDEQQRMARAQWEAKQRLEQPYRTAGASILARYGFKIPVNYADAPPEMGTAPGMTPAGPMGEPPGGMYSSRRRPMRLGDL